MKVEEYIESELSASFGVKRVAKTLVLVSPQLCLMHKTVNLTNKLQ